MRRTRRYKKLFDSTRNYGLESFEKAKSDLNAAHRTYHAEADLNASVSYWKEEVVTHNREKNRWLKLVALSILLTFASPVLYYYLGGITALTKISHANVQKETNSNQRTAPSPATPPQTNQAQVSYPTDPIQAAAVVAAPEENTSKYITAGIADLTGAALLVALMSIFIRLTLRQFNTHMFLQHEAVERSVMTKTYLALSNENRLTTDADRKLVLEALFRPSQANGVADTSVSTPIELVIKAISERKP